MNRYMDSMCSSPSSRITSIFRLNTELVHPCPTNRNSGPSRSLGLWWSNWQHNWQHGLFYSTRWNLSPIGTMINYIHWGSCDYRYKFHPWSWMQNTRLPSTYLVNYNNNLISLIHDDDVSFYPSYDCYDYDDCSPYSYVSSWQLI